MEKFELQRKIGEGTYGIVYKAQNKVSGTYVAIKKFKDSDDDEYVRKTALREIRILKQLKHDHIVDLLEVFREDNRIFLVFEQLNRTILDELQGRNDQSGIEPLEAKKIIWQILKACDFMHSHNIVHRDFKPENMLLSRNGVLKICDFGFARQLTKENIKEGAPLTEYVSTRWYRAPELLVGAPAYTHAVDVWAIGCIFVELVTGSALFSGDSDFEMLKLIIRMFTESEKLPEDLRSIFARNNMFKNVHLPVDDETAEYNFDNTLEHKLSFLSNNAAVSFARECLRMDPAQRPTAEQLLDHDYFNDFRDWFEDEIQTLMEYDQSEMNQGTWLKQRDSALKTRRIETILGENPVASTSQPNAQLQSQSQTSNHNVFAAISTNQGQSLANENNHSPAAPREAGTPIRESRLSNNAKGNNVAIQRRMTTNADTPTLNQSSKQQQAVAFRQSSFGSVIYDSNRKHRGEGLGFNERGSLEDHRAKQASSLSPSRFIQDISRQDAQSMPANMGLAQLQPGSQVAKQQLPQFGTSPQGAYLNIQLQSSFGSQGASGVPPSQQPPPLNLVKQASDDAKQSLYSVVIKEDPAEQLSPTFQARKGFQMMGSQAHNQGAMSLNRNSEFIHAKQKTFRERERERLNNESQNSRGRSVTKININFNGDGGGGGGGNPMMTSSATNLNINGSVAAVSPRLTDDNKFGLSKLYASNSTAISGIQTKKTLQSTNSTSNLESHQSGQGPSVGNGITKGAYYPTMRQRQARDNQLLFGLSTIQSSGGPRPDLSHGVMGVSYQHGAASSTITKTQPANGNKVSLPAPSINFPSFDDDMNLGGGGGVGGSKTQNQPGSLIQFHNNSNATLQNSQKSIQGTGSPTQGVSPKGQFNNQQFLAPSSSSYQFPLQALGQGLISGQNPSKEQPRLKAMMLRNQSSSSTSPMVVTMNKSLNSVGARNYNSSLNQQAPASSHGATSGENNQRIANQKTLNLDNMVSGPLPKPNVKIVDLQHNLLPFDSGIQGMGQLTAGSGGAIATNTGQQIICDSGTRIDAQSLKNQLKQGKKDAAGNQVMSQQQHYLLQQIHCGASTTLNMHHQLPQSSHNVLFNNKQQQQNLIITPKTPNDSYGYQQKAILHQIFDKGTSQSRSKVMTRHTTPFNQSFGMPGKMTTAGGSNQKLATIQQLMAHGDGQGGSKGALLTSNMLSSGTSSVPGGNRPGINSSGATIKKNGSMGLAGAGMGSYANYNQQHHLSSQLQSSYNNQSIKPMTLGHSGTISASQQQQILLASTQIPTGYAHPGSSGGAGMGYTKGSQTQHQHQMIGLNTNSSVQAPYGGQINKLSPTTHNSSMGHAPNTIFMSK